MTETPGWLKAAQNGSIAEARAKAFLLDRFWVLERSVDIEGADFIIQRRLTRATLMDRTPPRLGVVQVKFFEARGTTQYIPKEYVHDSNGDARPEFFVMCHSGGEDEPILYLIPAQEVIQHFEVVSEGKAHEGRYRIGGAQLFDSKQFLVTSHRLALDRIEHSLQAADFSRNRSFMSWLLPSARLQPEAIDPLYREPLENSWGDIPKAFLELKEKSRTALFTLEDVHQKFAGIVESTDPERAFDLLEEIAYECAAGRDWRVNLPSGLLDREFRSVVVEHKKKVETLKTHGMLDAYIEFSRTIKSLIASHLAPHMPLDRSKAHVLSIRYDSKSFTQIEVASEFAEAEPFIAATAEEDTWTQPHQAIIHSSRGLIRFWWIPGIYALSNKVESESWKEYVEHKLWDPYRAIMDVLYELHFNDGI